MWHIKEDIEKGKFHQIYLLYGEERYLRRQYRERLRVALCSDDTMNTHFYEGKDINIGEVIDLAETLPFFAPHRVIFIDNSNLFKSGGEKLAEYLTTINETTYFIFTEKDVDKRSKLFKTVKAKGYAAEFTVQDEKILKRWIKEILQKEGKDIADNTLSLFLEKTGTDMENIYMELEKLICYCMEQQTIIIQDVEAICTNRISNHIFEMINAIAEKQKKKALQLYYELLALKEAPMRILFLITRQYNLLLQIKEMKARGYDNKTIGTRIGLHPFVVGKYISQGTKFELSDLKHKIMLCIEMEEAVKTGHINDQISVEMLIMSI